MYNASIFEIGKRRLLKGSLKICSDKALTKKLPMVDFSGLSKQANREHFVAVSVVEDIRSFSFKFTTVFQNG